MLTWPAHEFCFDEFSLDTLRCVLSRGGFELPLRRQSFDVLRYLAEHPGRVVSSDELTDALWPAKPADRNGSVGQCIKEIRRSLGHDARWIIKTVSGRGYAFMAEIAPNGGEPPQVTSSLAVGVAAEMVAATDDPASGRREPRPLSTFKVVHLRSNWLLFMAVASAFAIGIWLEPWKHFAPRQDVLPMMAAPSITVLPFKAINPQNVTRSLLGLDAEVQSELARVHRGFDLTIKSTIKDSARSSTKSAFAQSDARYVVVGTTSFEHEVMRHNIQLIEAQTDRQVWSDSFELGRDRIGGTNRLAAQIARQLIIQVRTAESRRPLPAMAQAGHYVLLGRALHETERGPKSTGEALTLFRKARELDANSASALVGFATTRLVQAHNAWIPWEERPTALTEVDEAIERLVKLDPGNAAGHYLRASLLRARGMPDRAIASLEYAVSLNPSYSPALVELGRVKIDAGRANEAIGHLKEALELGPAEANTHVLYFMLGFAAVHTSDDRAALPWLLKARQINPGFSLAVLYLSVAYLGVGDEEQARASMADYLAKVPDFSIAGWKRWTPSPSPVVVAQRERIFDAWRHLGIPEDDTIARRALWSGAP